MERQTKGILGKRATRDPESEQAEAGQDAMLKRPKAQSEPDTKEDGQARTGTTSNATPRNGLLTPESSSLSESQITPVNPPTQGVPANPSFFPFMKLPAELRLHIYHMALVRHEPLLLHAERLATIAEEDTRNTTNTVTPPDMLPLLRFHVPNPNSFRESRQAIEDRSVDRTPPHDPVLPVVLRLNWTIYNEARQLLYSENVFTLNLWSGVHTLATLHQRSRSLIKHVILTIPSHHDILDGFADLVRLGLRYCWGLKTFKIILGICLPDDGRTSGTTSVYANAFHILRWLPKGCNVILEGSVSEQVKRVVAEEGRLMNVLDEVSPFLPRRPQSRLLLISRGTPANKPRPAI